MNDKKAKDAIKRAVEHATPDVLSPILESCQQPGEKNVLELPKKASNRKAWRRLGAMAAAFALVVGTAFGIFSYWNGKSEMATVSLDVNPSLTLRIDQRERVLEAKALNADAAKVLDGMDLKNADLKVAMNAIIGSMVKNGYLSTQSNSVLLSVQGTGADGLEKELMEEIDAVLKKNAVDGSILAQTVKADESLAQKAESLQISLGKARIIQSLCEQNPLFHFEDLAKLTINDLNLLAASKQLKPGDAVQTGTASDGKYIGDAAAIKSALAHLGTSESAVKGLHCELDVEDGRLVYEVEWTQGAQEVEVDVDAETGTALKVERNEEDTPDEDIDHDDNDGDRDDDHGDIDDDQDEPVKPSATDIGAERAKTIALEKAGQAAAGVRELDAKLDREEGRRIYEVSFATEAEEFEVEVDAANGTVYKVKREPVDD